MPLSKDAPATAEITEACRPWRQGDLALQEHWFAHACEPSKPLTIAAEQEGGEGVALVESVVEGLMVVTQTCDILRNCVDRPYVEVCPLIAVDSDKLEEVKKLRRPSLATLEVLASQGLVVDLDRVMTVEKSVLASWRRTPGCENEAEASRLASALSRKRSRFAFPDEFGFFVAKFVDRIKGKHGKESSEGEALRALVEIRVAASPSWSAVPARPMFWLIRANDDTVLTDEFGAETLKRWLKLMPATDRFSKPEGQLTRLQDMTAEEYCGSERLDLDYLSQS